MSDRALAPAAPAPTTNLVLRNTLFLLAAQAITTPLAILIHAAMGRYLGPAEFGLQYIATEFCGLGLILVEWGQAATVPALVARDRPGAARYLGSALIWRAGSWILVCAAMLSIAALFGYGRNLLITLFLVAALLFLQGVVQVCLHAVRGLERTDITAYASVAQQLLTVGVVVTVLVIGGRLWAVLGAQMGVAAVALIVVWRALRPLGIGVPTVRIATVRQLLVDGWPMLFFALAMVLQSAVDAAFLSRMTPPEVPGWHAAARRLTGVLATPAAALVAALYPTLSRLAVEDPAEFQTTTAKALRTSLLVAVPAMLGCALYPDIGIGMFSRGSFGPAENNLRVQAPLLLLV
jgi:O-antigen/teichoic acid export membrane protein